MSDDTRARRADADDDGEIAPRWYLALALAFAVWMSLLVWADIRILKLTAASEAREAAHHTAPCEVTATGPDICVRDIFDWPHCVSSRAVRAHVLFEGEPPYP